MKKITIDREEGVAEVIDRILGTEEDEVTLVIPKGSPLARSASNFNLLKREVDAAGKTVSIESVDDAILSFAKESGFDASHPLWRGVRGGGGVSDIIPAGEAEPEFDGEKPAKNKRKKKVEPVKLVVHEEEEGVMEEEGEEEPEEDIRGVGRFFSKRSAPELGEEDEDEGDEFGEPSRKRLSGRFIAIGILVVIAVFAVLGVITWSFNHVTIAITFQKSPWSYNGNFVADKSVSAASAASGMIPAQVFTADKNATQLFPASGSANVSLKAQGTITIYNAYSSAPQDLVATTRFVTSDGKLFRLVSGVTIPGAQVTNGKIIPSSITATVAADQPGPNYNVGPVAKLTIPGFQGSVKYDGFYGALLNGASGGFTGTRAVPTAADITSAKAKMTSILQADLTNNITTSYPNNFKILDGATNIQIAKLTVNTSTDQNGNFSVFGEATLQAIGFDESAFKDTLLSIAQSQMASSTWNTIDMSYGSVHADFSKGRVSFSVSAQGTLEHVFSQDDFKTSIAGKSIGEARTAISDIQGLSAGKISVWPMWLWSVPANPDKIEIVTN